MSVAIVQQPQTTAVNPFEPQNLDQAIRLSEILSKSGLVPSALRGKPADILIILMTARELGIGPMQGLSDIGVIQGKPVYSADLMVAQCKRRPNRCEYFIVVESTDDHATYEVKAIGAPQPERYTFTIADAGKMGLLERDNWRKQPRTMLRRRAAAQAAREAFQDLVRGYDPDEAEDFSRPPAQVAPTAPAIEAPPVVDVTPPPVEQPVPTPPPAPAPRPQQSAGVLAKRMALWVRLKQAHGEEKQARAPAAEAALRAAAEKVGVQGESKTWTLEQLDLVERELFPAGEPDDIQF